MATRAATTLGTPCAETWDADWLAVVDAAEQRLGRRICGAHAPDGEPCELGSTHRNGRCRFHGGHPRIGGQPGNRNALVHGLYSRRLRHCDDTCPMWCACPFSGADVMKLSEKKRPICAYEAEAYALMASPPTPISLPMSAPQPEYGEVEAHDVGDSPDEPEPLSPGRKQELKTALYRHSKLPPGAGGRKTRDEVTPPSETPPPEIPAPRASAQDDGPLGEIVEDTGGILYAMLQRATITVSSLALTERTEAESEQYSMRSTKVSAALTAFLRIAREFRAWLRLVPRPAGGDASESDRPYYDENGRTIFYDAHGEMIGLPDLMRPFVEEMDTVVEELRRDNIDLKPCEET